MGIISSFKPPIETLSSQSESNTEAEQMMAKRVADTLESLMNGVSFSPENSIEFSKVSGHIKEVINVITAQRPDELETIHLYILAVDELILTSFPPNIIVVSRSLVDSDADCGIQNKSEIIGLLAHELSHLWFGHTQEKWKWITLSNNVKSTGYAASFFNLLTSPVPIIPRLTTTSPAYLPDGNYSEWFFESTADLFALKVLSTMQLDINQYLAYWEKISSNVENNICITEEHIENIRQRVERIKAFLDISSLKNKIIDDIDLIVINTGEITKKIKLKNYRDMKKVSGLYTEDSSSFDDNRQKKTKNYLHQETSSDEFIGLLRNINYWKRAIRQHPNWKREFWSEEDVILLDTQGELKKNNGIPVTISHTSIPLSINGYSSFVFEGYSLDQAKEQ